MSSLSDDRLNHLLRDAYPRVQVSPDFTLRLWRKLMKGSVPPWWRVPAPALVLSAMAGMLLGFWTVLGSASPYGLERLDQFGNAPVGSVAGMVLDLQKGEQA